MKRKKSFKKGGKKLPRHLQHINVRAAGIDIGSRSHFVAVPEGSDEQVVREFSAFTDDLERMAEWLLACGVTTVAMESTGIYWIPVFEILESHGLDVKLVNARHVKNVPGRKSDVLDCQWLQQLHTYGLLQGAFRPTDQVCTLRAYVRQRATLVRSASSYIQRMQKALAQMNLQLHHVVADITGTTGMRIIKAILEGERRPETLAALRNRRCRNDEATIARRCMATIVRSICSACGRRWSSTSFTRRRSPIATGRFWSSCASSMAGTARVIRPPATWGKHFSACRVWI